MKKSNYALISALYASKTSGFYSDIYFPIIKYSIAKLFSEKRNTESYYDVKDVHNFIEERFGLKIPTIVIARSVQKIDMQKLEDMKIQVYEQGNTFKIQFASYNEEESIEEKETDFSNYLLEIESQYKGFLATEGKFDDGVSFVQFISDNTDDILGLIEEKNTNCVDEKYVTLIFFLQYLQDNNKVLYSIACRLFWSSIISAFLQSEVPLVCESTVDDKREYFLDTPIIMGLLKLSTSLIENYSHEVCEIIEKSGGILRVNPMTIREIKCIIQSVEINGPHPFTDIASACERYGLITNDLAEIRININKKIEAMGINIFPNMGKKDEDKIILRYKGKETVRLLGESRTGSKNLDSYGSDNYREIHDIYMDDYISERKKQKTNARIFFLTSNIDLVNFCKVAHEGENNMLSTGKVILDLWMHNRKPVDMSSCALTEIMARCLDLHRMNVLNKISEVARFFNKTKDKLNPEVYKEFIAKLYNRAKNVISVVENSVEENSLGESWIRLIKEAVAADNAAYDKEMARLNSEIKEKNEDVEYEKSQIAELQADNKLKDSHIEGLNGVKANLQNSISERNAKIETLQNDLKRSQEEKKIAISINVLHEQKDKLNDMLKQEKLEFEELETKRKHSFKDNVSSIFQIGGWLLVVIAILLILALLYIGKNFDAYLKFAGPMIALAGIFLGYFYYLKNNEFKRQNKAFEKWEQNHARYGILKQNINEHEKQMEKLLDKLSEMKS